MAATRGAHLPPPSAASPPVDGPKPSGRQPSGRSLLHSQGEPASQSRRHTWPGAGAPPCPASGQCRSACGQQKAARGLRGSVQLPFHSCSNSSCHQSLNEHHDSPTHHHPVSSKSSKVCLFAFPTLRPPPSKCNSTAQALCRAMRMEGGCRFC